jgi:hypothetical protein
MDAKVQIGGLAALNKGLRAISSEAPKQLRLTFNEAANTLVDKAKPTVPSVTGAARASMKARSTRTSARVAVGGKRAPYFPWLEFGGQGRVAGRPAPRPFQKEGRYIYPTLRRIRPDIEEMLQDGIEAVVSGAGLEID